jgi:hypothetical protein
MESRFRLNEHRNGKGPYSENLMDKENRTVSIARLGACVVTTENGPNTPG